MDSLPPWEPSAEEADLLGQTVKKFKRQADREVLPVVAQLESSGQRSFKETLAQGRDMHVIYSGEDKVDARWMVPPTWMRSLKMCYLQCISVCVRVERWIFYPCYSSRRSISSCGSLRDEPLW